MMCQMQVRRLKAIFQVSEPRRFAELEVGLAQLGRSVMALAADAELLTEARRFQGAAVLQGFADEEAAKALILLDIARCGWTDAASVSSCMAAFYNHLSRGLYAEVYAGRPADLEDIRKYVDALRRQFYLDGPTGIDWVFRNSVIDDRETALYVDYVQTQEGECYWTGPETRAAIDDWSHMREYRPGMVVRLVAAMSRLGLLTEMGLQVTREVWAGNSVDVDSMKSSDLLALNEAVVEALFNRGAAPEDADHVDVIDVIQRWTFPLSSLDLTEEKVKPKDLVEARDDYLEKMSDADEG